MTLLFVDSDLKVSGTSCCFKYKMPRDSHTYKKCTLLSSSIPKSFYTVPNDKNTFELNSVKYTITPQNYTYSSFLTYINALVVDAYPVFLTQDANKGRYIYTTPGDTVFTSDNNIIPRLFGLESPTIIVNASSSINVCQFTINNLIIKTDFVKNKQAEMGDSILAAIPLGNTVDFGIIEYENNHPTFSQDCVVGDYATFTLVDSDGNRINLNGTSVNYTLGFE